MIIQYMVEQTEDRAVVIIVPPYPINGFHGCTLNMRDIPEVMGEAFIEQRVNWKIKQEMGQQTDFTVERV